MTENQNIEYKQNWHDDYLKWICGFANAQGGAIIIGKDDSGKVIGVDDHKRLMNEIPNKVRNTIGITVEANLRQENSKYFIEIVVHPYSVPISLRGRYYYRSGSTKQELTGASLNEFLLKKSGKTWDNVIADSSTLADIDEQSVKIFLNAAEKAGRLPESEESLPVLLEKLRLCENGKLKRAAVILFGKDPGKYFPGALVKIGRFDKSDADIKYQDVEEGNIIKLLSAVLNQLNHKFLVSPIDFEGMHRIEKGEYPVAAVREMLLNALVHRSFVGAPIQIRVYDDKISIWNEGFLPEGITLDALRRPHASRPRNPVIADVCFKGGYIDAWGRGTIKIFNACKDAQLPEPEMRESDGGMLVTLFKNRHTEEQLQKLEMNDRQIKAVLYAKEKGSITNSIYQKINEIGKTTATEELQQLVDKEVLKQGGTKGRGSKYVLKS